MVKLRTKIVSVVLLVAMLMTEFSVFAVSEEIVHNNVRFSWYETADGIGAAMYKVKVAEKFAYCIDYQYQIPVDGTVSDLNTNMKLSKETLTVLKNGYPNVSYKDLGVASEDEAYVATQLAVWQVVSLKDNRHATNGFNLSNLTVKEEYKEQATRALNTAKKLAENSLVKQVNPSINIASKNAKTEVINGEFVAGPYELNVVDTVVEKYKVSLSNNMAYIADANGNKIEGNEVEAGKTFYVRWPETLSGSTMKVGVSAIANISKAVVCVVSEKGLQSFGVEVTDEVTLTASTNIRWETLAGKVEVTKVDQELNVVPGAKFELRDMNSNKVAEGVTDVNGKLVFSNIKIGKYNLVEVSAPAGYIKSTEVKNVEVLRDQTANVNVTNTKIYGNAKIIKVDDTGKVLSGVSFNIKNSCGQIVEKITTDETGVAVTSKLPYGKYTYTEVSAPANVAMDKNAHEFNISENNKVVEIKVVNQRIKGSLKIVKTDDLENKPLAGVVFKIADANGKEIEKVTTDKNGIAISSKLLKGKYTYQEVEVPEGIIIDSKKYDFEITENNQVVEKHIVNIRVKGGLVVTKVDDENKPIEGVEFEVKNSCGQVVEKITTDSNGKASTGKLPYGKYTYTEVKAPANVVMQAGAHEFIVANNNELIEKKVVNCKIKGSLVITKVDQENKPVANVKFEIKDSNGKVIANITTDKNGVAKVENLVYGEYSYKEVSAPANLVMDNAEYKFNVKTQNQVIAKKVVNKFVRGSLEITKKDNLGEKLEGVVFEIRNSNGKLVEKVTTDKNGIAKVSNLVKGEYTYKEVQGLTGYVMDNSKYAFEINKNNQVVAKEVINQKIFGKLKIVKTDDVKKAPLAGVTFEIKDENGKAVDKITTDKKGIAESKYLYAGKYTYQEVEVPEDIVIDDQEYPFVIEKQEEIIVKEIVNSKIKGSLRIRKFEKGTQNAIANVKFDIYDKNDNYIETIVTNENGEAVSSKLVKGKYYFLEKEAPSKYVVDSSKHQFEVTVNNSVVDRVVENEVRQLPKTGGLGTNNLIVLTVSLLSVGGYILGNKRKKK